MSDNGWGNTGEFPERMKKEIKEHQTTDKQISKAHRESVQSGYRGAERLKRRILTNRQLKRMDKDVLTHRARRQARKLFPKHPHGQFPQGHKFESQQL